MSSSRTGKADVSWWVLNACMPCTSVAAALSAFAIPICLCGHVLLFKMEDADADCEDDDMESFC